MREPYAAGKFYPMEKDALLNLINKMIDKAEVQKKSTYGIVSPHAGYIYSGWTAAHGYKSISNIKDIETVIVVGPSHTGMGKTISVSIDDWVTPLGKMNTDKEFVKMLIDENIKVDEFSHKNEHANEVQLPFLQYLNPNLKLVSIAMLDQTQPIAENLANKLTKIINKLKRKAIIVASSDLSHYESYEIAKSKDMSVIKQIEKMDIDSMYDNIKLNNVSACGYGPIAVLMKHAKNKGVKSSKLLDYKTSGDIENHRGQVVGYASLSMIK